MKIRSIQLCFFSSFLKLLSAAVLLGSGTAVVCGQTAVPDSFDPNANGIVRVILVQPNGKILVCGDFTTVSPNGGAAVTRNRIARFNADGTLDSAFDPNAGIDPNGATGFAARVFAMALQADGKILVGGSFTSMGGLVRNFMARLDAVTGAPDSFNANVAADQTPARGGDVLVLAVQSDGKILVGGQFNTIGGKDRHRLGRLDPATALADSFDPNPNGFVRQLAVQPNGQILVGGDFTGQAVVSGGWTRNHIARFNPVTGSPDSFNPNVNGATLFAVALQADGKILFGGPDFTTVGGQPRNRIARVNGDGTLDTVFDPNATNPSSATLGVNVIAVQADGRILTGGNFTTIGGQTRSFFARLDS